MDALAAALASVDERLAKARAVRAAQPKRRGALDERALRALEADKRRIVRYGFDHELAEQMYRDGLSLAGIALRFGVSKGVVGDVLRARGIKIRSNGLGIHAEAAE